MGERDAVLGKCSDVVRYALNRGADDAEVYAEIIEQKKVCVQPQNISVQELERKGMGIRIVRRGTAFASVNAFEGPRLQSVLEEAIKMTTKSPYDSILPEQESLPHVNLYDPSMTYMQLEEVRELAESLSEAAQSCDKRIQVENSTALINIHTKALVTSKGIRTREVSSTAVWELLGVARDGTSVSDFDYQCEGTHFKNRIHVEGAAQRLADATIPALGAHTRKDFYGEVVLAPEAVSVLSSYLAQAANADLVHKGLSYLKDKLHTVIAAPAITLSDDALLPDGLASSSFDREGVPHRTAAVIEHGVLASFLYDTAAAFSAGMKSTGHAAGGYRSRPAIEPTNLVYGNGEFTFDELLSDISHGILITRLSGTPDMLTGEFSLAAKNAVIICHGELKEPVRGLLFSGTMYSVLTEVTGITRELFPLADGYYPYIRLSPQELIG